MMSQLRASDRVYNLHLPPTFPRYQFLNVDSLVHELFEALSCALSLRVGILIV